MTNVHLAPGCFGAAVAFRPDSAECAPCPFASECSVKARASIATLRASLGVPAIVNLPLAKHVREKRDATITTPSVTERISALQEHEPVSSHIESARDENIATARANAIPKKAVELFERLRLRGHDLMKIVTSGTTLLALPADLPAFLRFALTELIRDRALDRQKLRADLAKQFNWQDTSASSHAGQVFGILRLAGFETDQNKVKI